MARLDDLIRFYDILAELERRLGGTRTLNDGSLAINWPARGVYFFFEPGETRSDTGSGPRVVRVGTHALTPQSRTSLGRLYIESIFFWWCGGTIIQHIADTGIALWCADNALLFHRIYQARGARIPDP